MYVHDSAVIYIDSYQPELAIIIIIILYSPAQQKTNKTKSNYS